MNSRLVRGLASGFLTFVCLTLIGCAATRTARNAVTHRADHDSLRRTSPALVARHDSEQRATTDANGANEEANDPEPDGDGNAENGRHESVPGSSATSNSERVRPVSLEQDETALDRRTNDGEQFPNPQYTLNLDSILQLTDSQNPNVALARERINEAYSRVQRAEALWLPSLRAGLNYNHHEGSIQNVAGNVFDTNRSAFGGGFGTNMAGAASPGVPGLIAQFHLSDAIFQPKIASHQAASRRFGATAARNDILRDAAIAYLELVRAEHGVAIALTALQNTERLTTITRQYSETGQGLQSDHQRMEAELAIRREQVLTQREALQVASARLAQVLHADPAVLIASGDPVVTPLNVMNAEESAAAHVVLGLSRRPELSEQKHLVCEAVERLNREKYAPLIPSVLLATSYGGMGGGLGNSITNSSSRWDADAIAYWELRNLGLGDRAAQSETASVARQAQMREVALLDRVAREVVEAHTQVSQRKHRVELSKAGIVAAERSYELNLQRIENAQGLPIEVLQSIQALATAQRSYLNAVVDYNVAQFELCRAIGWFVES